MPSLQTETNDQVAVMPSSYGATGPQLLGIAERGNQFYENRSPLVRALEALMCADERASQKSGAH